MKSKFEINVDDKKVNINITKFSDGTIQMNLGLDAYLRGGDIINVEASIVDNDGIIALCQLKDIIDNYFPKTINTCLSLQYIPYARYDRRMVDGDSFSLKVFTNILNSLSDLYETTLPREIIEQIMKDTIDGANWSFDNQSVDGIGGTDLVHLNSMKSWVMYPTDETIVSAKAKMNEILK